MLMSQAQFVMQSVTNAARPTAKNLHDEIASTAKLIGLGKTQHPIQETSLSVWLDAVRCGRGVLHTPLLLALK